MARVWSKQEGKDPKIRRFEIVGDTTTDVQAKINDLFDWIENLPGHNAADFNNPVRFGRLYRAVGFTRVSDPKSYDEIQKHSSVGPLRRTN